MIFQINNTKWQIKIVDEATINNEIKEDGALGLTIYKTQEILLLENQANIIKTLKHELAHVWLYEYGHNSDDEKIYKCEDVCEIVASSNDFINDVVYKFKNIKPLYLCDTEKNTECKKRICYINGGECMQTSNIEFAKKQICY